MDRLHESGTTEVYVRRLAVPASDTGGKWQISTGGGLMPVWSPNGREIFYQSADRRLMVTEYTVHGDSFRAGKPRLWSPQPLFAPGFTNMDLAPDGKRFAILPLPEAHDSGGAARVTFLLNFLDDLRRVR